MTVRRIFLSPSPKTVIDEDNDEVDDIDEHYGMNEFPTGRLFSFSICIGLNKDRVTRQLCPLDTI